MHPGIRVGVRALLLEMLPSLQPLGLTEDWGEGQKEVGAGRQLARQGEHPPTAFCLPVTFSPALGT